MEKEKDNLTFIQTFDHILLTFRRTGISHYIRRKSWPEKYFWKVRNYTYKPEDVQFKACIIESDNDANYLPTNVQNSVLCIDAIANDWEFYTNNE